MATPNASLGESSDRRTLSALQRFLVIRLPHPGESTLQAKLLARRQEMLRVSCSVCLFMRWSVVDQSVCASKVATLGINSFNNGNNLI